MALPTTTLFDYPTVEALGYYIAASRVRTLPPSVPSFYHHSPLVVASVAVYQTAGSLGSSAQGVVLMKTSLCPRASIFLLISADNPYPVFYVNPTPLCAHTAGGKGGDAPHV